MEYKKIFKSIPGTVFHVLPVEWVAETKSYQCLCAPVKRHIHATSNVGPFSKSSLICMLKMIFLVEIQSEIIPSIENNRNHMHIKLNEM